MVVRPLCTYVCVCLCVRSQFTSLFYENLNVSHHLSEIPPRFLRMEDHKYGNTLEEGNSHPSWTPKENSLDYIVSITLHPLGYRNNLRGREKGREKKRERDRQQVRVKDRERERPKLLRSTVLRISESSFLRRLLDSLEPSNRKGSTRRLLLSQDQLWN